MKKIIRLLICGTIVLLSGSVLFAQSGIGMGNGTAIVPTTPNPTTPRCSYCGIRLYTNTQPWDHKTNCPYYRQNPSTVGPTSVTVISPSSSSSSVSGIVAGALVGALGNALADILSDSGSSSSVTKAQKHAMDSEIPYNSLGEMRTLTPGYHKVNFQWEDRAVIVYKAEGKKARPVFKDWPTRKDEATISGPEAASAGFAILDDHKSGYLHVFDCSQVPEGQYAKDISNHWATAKFPNGNDDFKHTFFAIAKYREGVKPYSEQKFIKNKKQFYKDIVWGLVDMTGKEILPCQYDSIALVNDNCAILKQGGKWGKVDGSMKIVLPFEYSWLGFGDKNIDGSILTKFGHADGRWKVGLLSDATTKILIPENYDALITVGDKNNFIDNGNGTKSRIWIVKTGGKFGLVTTENEIKILPVCDSMEMPAFTKDRWALLSRITSDIRNTLLVKANGKWGIADFYGETVIPLTYSSREAVGKAIEDLPKNSFKYYFYSKYPPEAKGVISSESVERAQTAFFLDKMMGGGDRVYEFVLSSYNADNQCFTIINKACPISEFQLYVPIGEAIAFKNNFDAMKKDALTSAKPCIFMDGFSLSEFTFTSPDGKTYHYSNPYFKE